MIRHVCAGRVVEARCDMSYQGGGWTRVLACGGRGGGREQPWTTWDRDDYYTVRHDVLQLAANATQARAGSLHRWRFRFFWTLLDL